MDGDWYLFENHRDFRVCGAKVIPFIFPNVLTPRIFTLEFKKKILNVDYIHFVSNKHNVSFKLKKEIDSFIVNNKESLHDVENIFQDMGF
jgi:hypothetical protein